MPTETTSTQTSTPAKPTKAVHKQEGNWTPLPGHDDIDTVETDVMSVPAMFADERVPESALLPSIGTVVRHNGKSVLEVFVKAVSSRRHAYQDAAMVIPLPHGRLFVSVSDGATNSKVISTEDATRVVQIEQLAWIKQKIGLHRSLLPSALIQDVHGALHRWLARYHNASTGVAHSVAVIDANGQVTCASIGDCPILHYQRGGLFRRHRLTPVSRPTSDSSFLHSSLGQKSGKPLDIDVAQLELKHQELLLLGSDGGLPTGATDALRDGIQRYFSERKAGRLTALSELGEGIDGQAREKLTYDDDRTLVLVQRLS